jgi:hypothetical protein
MTGVSQRGESPHAESGPPERGGGPRGGGSPFGPQSALRRAASGSNRRSSTDLEDAMPRAKELKIRAEDRPGVLGEIATALGEKKVNLRAVNAWVEGNEGVVRMVVDKVGPAKRVLAARGWQVEEKDVVELELPDKPGALGEAASALGDAGVNIEYLFVGTGGARKATVFIGVADVAAAMKALR